MTTASSGQALPTASRPQRLTTGTVVAVVTALLICLPIISVVWLALFPSENIWPHLYATVLPGYLFNTFLLMAGVATGTLAIGVTTAWVVTHYEFTGRNLFVWALLLPFAVPAYVIAFIYTDLLEYSGPLQSSLRHLFGWQTSADYYFPSIRSLGGAICMMVLVLYPYVYLLARAAFIEQSASLLEAARVLGQPRRKGFMTISLPLARPAIAVGVAMALMETLNDFGTVDYFAVRTLTSGLYDVWLNMDNLGGGAQIASLLLIFVFTLFGLERISRAHQKQFQPSSSRFSRVERPRVHGLKNAALFFCCAMPVLLGFLIPAVVLLNYSITNFTESWTPDFRETTLNSLLLSLTAATIATFLGIFLAYSSRINKSGTLRLCTRLASTGYALPGAVLAIGILVPLASFDNTVDAFFRRHFEFSTGLILSGTVVALILAYVVRFLAVAFGSVESSLDKITPSMDLAARSLGQSSSRMLWRVHLPLMRSGIITAMLVVFVDCMKELPATLVLRPFNFDTLATHVYQFASDELIEESALAALLIVLTGLIPVILLSKTLDRSQSVTKK
ncbi:iron ABC transporter permease [Chromatiales bacterium (ex Bugula neritina AB1)]|nr:iron ABC transporter permease [Chromatiales bacterium (ex Bugula neritina AB1)]